MMIGRIAQKSQGSPYPCKRRQATAAARGQPPTDVRESVTLRGVEAPGSPRTFQSAGGFPSVVPVTALPAATPPLGLRPPSKTIVRPSKG